MSTKIAKSSVSKAPFSPRSASVGNVSTKKTVTKTTTKASAKKAETKTVTKNSTKKAEVKNTMKKPEPKTKSKDVAKTSVKSSGSKEKEIRNGTTDVKVGNIGIFIGTKVGVVNTYGLNQNITTSNSSISKYIPPENNYVPSTSNTSMIYNSSGIRSTYTPGYSQPQKSNDKTQSSSSAYLDRPKSVEISKNATQSKNNSIGVVLASSDRPAESYPTPKEERDAAEKQQKYALKHPKIVTTVPPKTVKPIKKPKPIKTKNLLKPKPAPEPTFFESEINPFIKLNNKQIKGLKTGVSLALSMLPIVGDAKDLAEFITGKDLITGQKLSKLERVAALVSICIPYVSAAGVVAAKGAVKQGGKQVFKKVSKETGEKLLNELGEDGLQEISEKMLKKLDAKELKKVEETLEKAEKERKTKEVLEKAVDGGKIGGKGKGTTKFRDWDSMKEYYKGTITKFVNENKPKYSPNIKEWFEKGGAIEIEMIGGKQVWTYISKTGDAIPYVNGYVKFPQKYLNPTISSIDIGTFSGNREKDIRKMMSILKEDYGLTEIPEGYVVHHDVENGILQLVQENIHKEFTHIGGYSLYK